MPRDVVALVSVEDFVSAVRIYSDRVYDLLRRGGVAPAEAAEVTESFALALLDAVVNAPETVIDLAGWWFARALELTNRAGVADLLGGPDEPVSLLAGTEGEAAVREALATLPEAERVAVALRDAYDLPPQAVAVALRRSVDAAASLTADGRLHLVSAYDDRRVPTLGGHTARMSVDVTTLSRLAEGSLESPRAAPLRRHASNCPACEDVVETLEKGRRLAAGLPIVAMPEDTRDDMLEAVESRAVAVLPSHDLVLRAVDEDHDPKPAISPLLVIIAVALALLLGLGVALLTRPRNPPAPYSAPTVSTISPAAPAFTPPAVTTTTTSPPDTTTSEPTTPATDQSTASTPTAGGSASAPVPGESSSPPATVASIFLSPDSGPVGTGVRVTGSGWPVGGSIVVSISGGGSTTVRSSATGEFTVTVTAPGPLPARRTVTAHGGGHSASASFRETL